MVVARAVFGSTVFQAIGFLNEVEAVCAPVCTGVSYRRSGGVNQLVG
jgi:ABC-type glucose/galactose transport system permease subunit